MGAAILKSCFSGESIETPRRFYQFQQSSTSDSCPQYDESYFRLSSTTMPPSDTANLNLCCVNHLYATSVESLDKLLVQKYSNFYTLDLPPSVLHLQQHNQDVGKLKKSSTRSVSSETTTLSESSVVAKSPSHEASPLHGFHSITDKSDAGFSSLLPPIYKLICVAGKGTTSTCYKIVRRTDGLHLACKIIDKNKLAPHARRRKKVFAQLRLEVDVLRRIDHPHIAKLEESFEDSNYLVLIMELMEGGELFDAIVEKGRFSECDTIHVARSVLSAIQHMHERGVMHRDLKPENMLLHSRHSATSAIDVKIIDFGFAGIIEQGATSTSFLGTEGYLAPEILLRQAYGTSVDMWSFGVLTYLLLCGRLPFAASTKLRPNQTIQAFYKLTFPKKYWHGVSPVAIDFLERVMVINPSTRLTAMEALNHDWLRN
ncbi:putative protein kinase [Plasmopara halstedii]